MALHKVFVDDFYDFTYKLIAIHCSLEDYRLAYILNKKLGIILKRKNNDLDFNHLKQSYSIFEWNNHLEYVTWNLISNTSKVEEQSKNYVGTLFDTEDIILKKRYLIPEYKKVDYFLKILDEINNVDENLVLKTLQTIPQIITSYSVNPLKIKSKDHLIF